MHSMQHGRLVVVLCVDILLLQLLLRLHLKLSLRLSLVLLGTLLDLDLDLNLNLDLNQNLNLNLNDHLNHHLNLNLLLCRRRRVSVLLDLHGRIRKLQHRHRCLRRSSGYIGLDLERAVESRLVDCVGWVHGGVRGSWLVTRSGTRVDGVG
ncbi:hypothetical protein CPB84DRAFT_1799829 [Gymnopilus junonius]|uniref:Uncharacterized protein n=1 Tax=Gymnopilus junonius TaxID=109634 RepID=A0A9P5N7S6_GYMJU|nr:hypothetical protein CPB84DRAFT_1799829 [Gymnopilus junonius]